MKRIAAIFLTILLCLTLTGSGVFAKGKPSLPQVPAKEKEKVATQKTEDDKQKVNRTEAEQTANQAKNYGQVKKLEERIRVRGMNLKFDVPPVIKEGRTLIPLRAIMNGLGAEVEWNDEEKTVTITRDDKVIVLCLLPDPDTGKYIAIVNGEVIELDVPAQLVSNRTFVPLRFLAQTLGEKVDYDEETGEIDIGDEETNDEDNNDEDNDEDTNDEDSDEDSNEEDDDEDNDNEDNDENSDDEDTNGEEDEDNEEE